MRGPVQLEAVLWGQRGHLFPWAPVCVAAGIGAYFTLRTEPGAIAFVVCAGFSILAAAIAMRRPGAFAPLLIAAALASAGGCISILRAHIVAAPKLTHRYYGPIEGRVVGLDRSASDALRITLDRVVLHDMDPARVPKKVRISVHGVPADPTPGQRIMTTGHLMPPQGPAEPGGFDFRRHAWFQGLGAVGYVRMPVLAAAPADRDLAVFRWRMAVADGIRAALPGDVGGVAAAVTTGDRSGVSQAALDALRASNLAHLLAISGLHMGLLAGVVFAALRYGMAMAPAVALRWRTKKIAAVGALLAGAAYLVLSGGGVATERAYIMVSVALVAILLDRRALSLRAVAMAALIVLTLRPDSVLGPGFQMSFAATTGLVAAFSALRTFEATYIPKWARPVLGVVASSFVAGLATAPVSAAHFNAIAQYGLLANLICVPVMAMLVVPAAVVAACLAPLGLQDLGLVPMGWGLDWILSVAHLVASWNGARIAVVAPDWPVLPCWALGGLWLCLWKGRGRWFGVVPMTAAFWIWSDTQRPPVLVAEAGNLVGVMTESGRALSKPRGAGFVARVWLENDGDLADQRAAAQRWPEAQDPERQTPLGPAVLHHVTGKRAATGFSGCAPGDIVIAPVPIQADCTVFDPSRLAKTGSLAIYPGARGVKIVSAQAVSGARIWNSPDSNAFFRGAWPSAQ